LALDMCTELRDFRRGRGRGGWRACP